VTELRFHRELYAEKAVADALELFAPHASFERADEPSHLVVRISGRDAAREQRIASELANFALGLTIKSGGPAVTS
jgi:hypothetical protein